MGESEAKFGINLNKNAMCDNQWSFSIGLSHSGDETYIYINLFKWAISIGKFAKYD